MLRKRRMAVTLVFCVCVCVRFTRKVNFSASLVLAFYEAWIVRSEFAQLAVYRVRCPTS